MKIVVLVKQVPDTNEVKLDRTTGTLIREGVPSIINPEDENALEEALKLKESHGAEVVVLSMGPPQAEDALREALAMGADEAILLTDRAFAGADTWSTASTLGLALKRIGNFDLVLAGRQAIDGDTAQVGPQVAEYVKIPQVTYVRGFVVEDGKIRAERVLEDGFEEIEAQLPALLTITKEANVPRYPPAGAIIRAYREQEVTLWGAEDIGADPETVGLKGSPTQVKRSFTPPPKEPGQIIKSAPSEAAKDLVAILRSKNII
ncbi:MAG TPA: electron transfer flavoprotein subunit beta/FixA family protein [Anaerolineae bacterium]|nr:electron transfer flavoprotein subunit beta/FixA family protein [Anaerolineae bacterium]